MSTSMPNPLTRKVPAGAVPVLPFAPGASKPAAVVKQPTEPSVAPVQKLVEQKVQKPAAAPVAVGKSAVKEGGSNVSLVRGTMFQRVTNESSGADDKANVALSPEDKEAYAQVQASKREAYDNLRTVVAKMETAAINGFVKPNGK